MLSSERYWTITQFNIYKIYFRFYILYICVLYTYIYLPCELFPRVPLLSVNNTCIPCAGGGDSGCSKMDIILFWDFFSLFFFFLFLFSFNSFQGEEYPVAKCCLFLHKPNSFCLNKWKLLCFCLVYSLARFGRFHHGATTHDWRMSIPVTYV